MKYGLRLFKPGMREEIGGFNPPVDVHETRMRPFRRSPRPPPPPFASIRVHLRLPLSAPPRLLFGLPPENITCTLLFFRTGTVTDV